MTTPTNTPTPTFYHGTRADLEVEDLIGAGYSSNYGKRKQGSWVYPTGALRGSAVRWLPAPRDHA